MIDSKPEPRRGRVRFKWLLRGTSACIFVWLLTSYLVARQLTGRPHPLHPEPVPELTWGKIESFRLTTNDGIDAGAWFIEGHADKHPVLLIHGNGSCRSQNLREAQLISQVGYPVLLLTVRAHGDSKGDRNDFGYSARQEVIHAVKWLEGRCPNRSPVIWGRSLGSAAAIFASEQLGPRVRGYLLECPYRDLKSAVRNRTRDYLPIGLDYVAYTGLLCVAPWTVPDLDRISPVDAVSNIAPTSHVLILAGDHDRKATVDDAMALRDRCRGRVELQVIANGEHLRLEEADSNTYRAAVLSFLARCDQLD